jgi:stage III sporulation protein SpoIIIAA
MLLISLKVAIIYTDTSDEVTAALNVISAYTRRKFERKNKYGKCHRTGAEIGTLTKRNGKQKNEKEMEDYGRKDERRKDPEKGMLCSSDSVLSEL